MRAEFRKRTSGLADDESDSDVLTLLNRYFKFVIPRDVMGNYVEGTWTFTLTQFDTVKYFDTHIISVKPSTVIYIDSGTTGEEADGSIEQYHYLRVYNDQSEWDSLGLQQVPVSDSNYTPPENALISGRRIFFDLAPFYTYRVNVSQARMGPSRSLATGADDGSGTGIADDIHAMAVVTGAAWDFLTTAEDTDGAEREIKAYEGFKNLMLTASTNQSMARRPRRTF